MIQSTVLMCHAPIVIPEIGQDRAGDCQKTTASMQKAADFIVSRNPDCLVVLSPHTPRHQRGFSYFPMAKLFGDFSRFGFDELKYEFNQDLAAISAMQELAQHQGVDLKPLRSQGLDHGALVPLHFLVRGGWQGSVLVFGLPYESDHSQLQIFGQLIQLAAQQRNQKWIILASGDMSHRLFEGAPAGYHPHGKKFDQTFVDHIKSGDYQGAASISNDLRDQAAEDVVDTVEIATAALDFQSEGHHFLSYEGPFGVGYSVAILQENQNS